MVQPEKIERILRPEDISLPAGYKIALLSTILRMSSNGLDREYGMAGKHTEMFITDFGIGAVPASGVIWNVTKL